MLIQAYGIEISVNHHLIMIPALPEKFILLNQTIDEKPITMEHSEKRDFIRMTANSEITYQEIGETQTRQGHCINLSAAGILFETDHPVEPGSLVQINITPQLAVVKPLDATIKVLRASKNTNGKFAIAGQIKEIN